MSTAIADPEPDAEEHWLSGVQAARALHVPDKRAIKRLVSQGLIRVRALPVRARYAADDVARLAAQSTTTIERLA